MIARIQGNVIEIESNAVIVDVTGVGYRVRVGVDALARTNVGDIVSMRIHHHITDDSQTLFGFADEREEKYFRLLLKVPKVGAATARKVLDIAPPHVLEQAVVGGDVAMLTKVSGVGKKMAERIVIELKGKITASAEAEAAPATSVQHETVEALVSIGFTPVQARAAAQKLPKEVSSVEDAVKAVLKQKA